MSSLSKTQQETYDLLSKMSGDNLINALTDFMGMQILTDEFANFLVDEGLANESDFSELFEEEEEEEEEDEDEEV